MGRYKAGQCHGQRKIASSLPMATVLISEDKRPLQNTLAFMIDHLQSTVSGVHILPFFPFTSDDGFAVSDYENVRPDLGDWADITPLARTSG